MAPPRYLTPFAFLALLPLGSWLGGPWTFTAGAVTAICMPSLDSALGQHEQRERHSHGQTRWLPRIYILVQLAVTAWIAIIVSRPGFRLFEAVGLAISAGVTTGVFGFVAAHELIHSEEVHNRGLGLTLLATTFYMHFHIAHLGGHHQRAATDGDPASARLGEGLYVFILRSIGGQIREAWIFEAERLRSSERRTFGFGNRMMFYIATEATLLIALALVNWRALVFVLAVAIVAIGLLETFNYIAHYGLRRRVGSDGRVEPLASKHSWNSKKRMDDAALLNMGCHSDHHLHPSRPFDQLRHVRGAAELPFGYATALLTALIPPLWKRIMDERAIAAMAAPSEFTPECSR